MKKENVVLGMKVVPHSKSEYFTWEGWLTWENNPGKNFFLDNGFLYVSEIEETGLICLSEEFPSNHGDYFNASDFEPYDSFQEVEQKTEQVKIPFTVIMPL